MKKNKTKKIDSQQLDTTGLFYSSIWFYQVELCVTFLQSQQKRTPARELRGALTFSQKTYRSTECRKYQQLLVFYTTAYTVQLRT